MCWLTIVCADRQQLAAAACTVPDSITLCTLLWYYDASAQRTLSQCSVWTAAAAKLNRKLNCQCHKYPTTAQTLSALIYVYFYLPFCFLPAPCHTSHQSLRYQCHLQAREANDPFMREKGSISDGGKRAEFKITPLKMIYLIRFLTHLIDSYSPKKERLNHICCCCWCC